MSRYPDRAGFLMAKSIVIENYRCFQSLSLPDCRRINLVIGENGTGKTAFMETLYLVLVDRI